MVELDRDTALFIGRVLIAVLLIGHIALVIIRNRKRRKTKEKINADVE